MKYFLILFILLMASLNCHAQNFELQLTGNSVLENKIIDSLGYISKHKNIKSLSTEIEQTSQKLSKLGYIQNKVTEQLKINDTTYIARFNLGTQTKYIHIYVGKIKTTVKLLLPNTKQDTIFLNYTVIENFLNQNTIALENKGYSLAKLKLTNIQRKKNTLFAELSFESENQRKLNSIVIKYTNKLQNTNFPASYLAQINRKYKNKIFNQDLVAKIHNEFKTYNFITQTKYPEILFTKDSTKVYLYLENRKSNTFDGFIGFSNNENKKITLNGYLDLTLENTLQVGEQFSLYWKSDGNQQRTFNTSLELPYLFKSPIGLKAQLNIFKQDSTFQNTKTEIDISYFINYNTRSYIGYQSTVSSDIQNSDNTIITDYKNKFVTANLNYSNRDYTSTLFFEKSSVALKTGLGKRETDNQTENSEKNKQFYIELQAMHNFYFNAKNNINIKTQNYYLHSSDYLDNELYRFGGVNSIRGFTENSLAANFMTSIITEYRYIASPNLYFHTILDYCRLTTSSTTDNKTNLLGIGIGMGAKTTTGLLKISLANGGVESKKIYLYNTIIHISYNVKF
ncbi:hypothetical protein QO200_01290 [Flavobacterium sp. Arc3]|uniref:hypothetical protein n=1 Tax=Flavobacterium sp. Arc3 TaxID=3046686 RepID=UPI00352EE21B